MERFHDVGGDDIHARAAAVMVACPQCGGLHAPAQKRRLNIGARWIPEGCSLDEQGLLTGTPRRSRIASFWMEGPAAAFQTWESQFAKLLLAEQEYETTGSEDKLRSTITLDQGRPYLSRARISDRQADALIARKEDMGKRVVPRGVRFLTASIDVQGGKNPRFVVQVEGHGINLENWIVDRYNIRFTSDDEESEFYRKIDPAGHPEDWDILIEKVISRSYPLDDGSGRALPILMVACDSGGEDGVTANAYEFWRRIRRRSLHRRFMLVKGASTKSPPYRIKETYPDNTGRSDRKVRSSGDVPVYLLNTNDLKDAISASLDRNDPGPGYRHFPEWLGDWFFEELTAEIRTDHGWENPGAARNEAFDLSAYNRAAVIKLGAERMDWDNAKPWALDWDENSEIILHASDRPDITPTRQSAPRARRRKIRMHA
jgi:phage terminase large subunit GpA-like protein